MPAIANPVLPRVKPIVPVSRPQPFSNPGWLFEPKYDGFRGMLYLTRQGCTLYSKRGNAMTRFRDLVEQLRAELPRREVILDGEIVALDEEGRIDFWDLMRGGVVGKRKADPYGSELPGTKLRIRPTPRRRGEESCSSDGH